MWMLILKKAVLGLFLLSFINVFLFMGVVASAQNYEHIKKPKRTYINSATRRVQKSEEDLGVQKLHKKNPSSLKLVSDKKQRLNEEQKAAVLKIEKELLSADDLEIKQVLALAKKTEKKIEETIFKIENLGESIQNLPLKQKGLALKNRRKLIDQTRILVQMREEMSDTLVSLDPDLNILFDNEFHSQKVAQRLSQLEMTQLAHLIEEEISQVSQQIDEISVELDGFTSSLRIDIDSIKSIAALK